MNALNKTAGAMFLSQSRFRTNFRVTNEMIQGTQKINHKERIQYELFKSLTYELQSKFSKEIKIEQYRDDDNYSLELYVFPPAALKLAVEYIILEMPQSEIDRIRTLEL
jgi:hypothetical protein